MQTLTRYCREEGEKFNIWQARLNLEMQYGDPPEEAVMKLFQRALSYTDQKKLYMALITILERADKVNLGFTFGRLPASGYHMQALEMFGLILTCCCRHSALADGVAS